MCIRDSTVAEQMDEHALHALGLLALDGVQRVHGELELAVHKALEQEDDGGDDDGDDRHRRGEVGVAAGLTHEGVVDLSLIHISLAAKARTWPR